MVRKRSPKPARKKKTLARKPPTKKKPSARKAVRRSVKRPARAARKTARRRKLPPLEPGESRAADFDVVAPPPGRGLGLESGGQAGDTEGLSRGNLADS